MSMVLCTTCRCLIDSDDQPECFIEETDLILCATHREEYEEEHQPYTRADYLADLADSQNDEKWLEERA